MRLHFSGIGGSGMQPLAKLMLHRGAIITGSDRTYDKGIITPRMKELIDMGIEIYPQNGSGVNEALDYLVVSGAVEETVPDYCRAKSLKVPIIHRSLLLAEIFNQSKGIAVGGTSGKTTVTGMIAYTLHHAGIDASFLCGDYILDGDRAIYGNMQHGKSEWMVVEADESDGNIVNYMPNIGVLLNISKDHKTLKELNYIFACFAENTKDILVYNIDSINKSLFDQVIEARLVSFGLSPSASMRAVDIELSADSSKFRVNDINFKLCIPGLFNVYNALAAISVLKMLNIELDVISHALSSFGGIHRRMQLLYDHNGIKIYDDFAHNPDKIKAALTTLKPYSKRLIAFFQPHGYAPARMMLQELTQMLPKILGKDDRFYIPPIYYAGGTIKKDIDAMSMVEALLTAGVNAIYLPWRAEFINETLDMASSGDTFVIMGARDDSLPSFAGKVAEAFTKRFSISEEETTK